MTDLLISITREIEDLHRWFADWFRGGLPDTPAVLARLEVYRCVDLKLEK